MKILFISTMAAHQWGGSEELWSDAAKEAVKQGHEILISIYKWPALPDKVQELKKAGAKVVTHQLKQASFLERAGKKLLSVFRGAPAGTYKSIVQFNPDRICISQGSAFDIIGHPGYTWTLQQLNRPYTIIIQHNFENGVSFNEADRRTALDIYGNAGRLFFVSQRNLEVFQRQMAHSFPNSMLIHNPVNINNKRLLPWPPSSTLQMACVARYEVAYKGQDILLQVLASDSWRERDYVLRLFGKGPDERYLADLIKYYDLQEKVFLMGETKDIDAIWAESHVLVLPSLSEGTPLSLVEAMLCGRPAVGTDVGGIGTLIKDGITGYLSPCASEKCLADALEKMWLNRHELGRMGSNAWERTSKSIDHFPGDTLLSSLIASN